MQAALHTLGDSEFREIAYTKLVASQSQACIGRVEKPLQGLRGRNVHRVEISVVT